MPELPEVETVVRTLELLIPDRRIEHVEVRMPKMIQMDAGEFCRRLRDSTSAGFRGAGNTWSFRWMMSISSRTCGWKESFMSSVLKNRCPSISM